MVLRHRLRLVYAFHHAMSELLASIKHRGGQDKGWKGSKGKRETGGEGYNSTVLVTCLANMKGKGREDDSI